MIIKYQIHKIGTPTIALPNHWTYNESLYWNEETGWDHKSKATTYDNPNLTLMEDAEWVGIYVNEPVEEDV